MMRALKEKRIGNRRNLVFSGAAMAGKDSGAPRVAKWRGC